MQKNKEAEMKTVQEYLREADRDRLLDSVAYDEICNTELLLEYPDKTIAQIHAKKNLCNRFFQVNPTGEKSEKSEKSVVEKNRNN